MSVNLACVPSPSMDAGQDTAGCAGGGGFAIYDESCNVRGSYGIPDCGTPFIIEENFLADVLTVTTVNMDVGDPYFSFLYGDGQYSINNNHCVCVDDGGGLEAIVACRCAFPVDGHFTGKRAIEFKA
jgi:hypothetical protein